MCFEILFEGDGIVVLLVSGAVHQCHRAFADDGAELRYGVRMLVQFTEISPAELSPFAWVVAEPSAEFSARRQFLEPEIDLGCIL
jgi:hypothetical protein